MNLRNNTRGAKRSRAIFPRSLPSDTLYALLAWKIHALARIFFIFGG